MDLTNEDFVAGAIAAADEKLNVDFIAIGNMESVIFTWYRIYDPNSEECVVALSGDDGVTSIEICEADDKKDLTRALLKTLNFGEDTDEFESEAWLCVLDEGHVNAELVDKEMLRETLEAGAAQLGTEFDFDQWAQKSGYA
jgi:hypothetical protein